LLHNPVSAQRDAAAASTGIGNPSLSALGPPLGRSQSLIRELLLSHSPENPASAADCGPCIVTSNKPFSTWSEIFGDDMAATSMIDRLILHSEILSLKGDSYRLRGKDLETRIGAKPAQIA
jgi:hypothetical protein